MCEVCELYEMDRVLELALGPKALRRQMTTIEATFGDVVRVRDDMILAEAAIFTAAAPVVEKMARQMVAEAEEMGMDLRGLPALSASYVGELATVLYEAYLVAMQAGVKQIADARKAQTGLAFVDVPNRDPDNLIDYARMKAEIDAARIASELAVVVREEVVRQVNQGIRDYSATEETAVGAGLTNLGAVARYGSREMTGMGRLRAQDEVRDEINQVVYTAILDDLVCVVCASMDGQTYGSDEMGKAPNNGCLGAPRCRCYEIVIFKREAA